MFEPGESEMSTLLIVDDSQVARSIIANLLKEVATRVLHASDGREALDLLSGEVPDLVLTDLIMPGRIGGLEVVAEIRRRLPHVPVMVVTGHGSEEVAAEALAAGAAGYIPKRMLERNLCPAVKRVLDVSSSRRSQQRLFSRLRRSAYLFVLDNDASYIPTLINHLRESIVQLGLCDDTDVTRVCVALDEALTNAVFHGNLEISSELREQGNAFYDLAAQRRNQAPFMDRRIYVKAKLGPDEAIFTIRDEGPGFDLSGLPDPTDTSNLERLSGRGIMLMMMFMDDVAYNETGNEVTMTKRSSQAPDPSTSTED